MIQDRKKIDRFVKEIKADIIKHFYECGNTIQPANVFLLKKNGKYSIDGFELPSEERMRETIEDIREKFRKENMCVKSFVNYRMFGDQLRIFVYDGEEDKTSMELIGLPCQVSDNITQHFVDN